MGASGQVMPVMCPAQSLKDKSIGALVVPLTDKEIKRMKLTRIRTIAASCLAVAGVGAHAALGAYPTTGAAYAPAYQGANAGYGYQQQQPAPPYQQPAQQPYPQAGYGQPGGYPQAAQAGYGQPAVNYRQPAGQGYPAAYQRPPQVAMTPEVVPTPDASASTPIETNGQTTYNGPYPSTGQQAGEGYAGSSAYHAGDASAAGYGQGAYGQGGYDGYGYADSGYGIADYCGGEASCGPRWFVGVYGLLMERDDSNRVNLVVSVDTVNAPPSYPYYPPASASVLSSSDVDFDFQGGAEIRFGSTFGGGGCGGYDASCCGCGCACQNPYAWEAVYWGLVEDDNVAYAPVQTGFRLYTMLNFAGVQYDLDGAGGMYIPTPMNQYVDHQIPVEDPAGPDAFPNTLLNTRVRSSFSAQNVEVNFLRFPVVSCGGTCGGCSYGGGYDAGGYGYGGYGCDSGYCDCGPPQQKFSIAGLCGVRWLRLDEQFQFATMFQGPGLPAPPAGGTFTGMSMNELYYDIDVENNLVGFQLGCDMNWAVACRWDLFCNTNFGIYNNHITHYQRVFSGGGGAVTFANGDGNLAVNSSKDDVSFVGEARCGVGYLVTPNCRLTAAWRAIAVTGVANAVDQIPRDFSNRADIALVESSGSLILHGLQAGAEFKY